jgi:hypothetical protein
MEMPRPARRLHPDRTAIRASLLLLSRLNEKSRADEYDTLRKYLNDRVIGGVDALFLPALHFLFLFGLVECRPKRDSLECVGL